MKRHVQDVLGWPFPLVGSCKQRLLATKIGGTVRLHFKAAQWFLDRNRRNPHLTNVQPQEQTLPWWSRSKRNNWRSYARKDQSTLISNTFFLNKYIRVSKWHTILNSLDCIKLAPGQSIPFTSWELLQQWDRLIGVMTDAQLLQEGQPDELWKLIIDYYWAVVFYLLRIHMVSYWTYTRNTSQHNKLGNHAGWLTWRDSLLLCLCIQSLRVRRTQGAVSSHWGRTVQGLCLDILSDTMTPLEILEHLWEKS